MKNISLLLFILFPVLLFSQTQTENYIKTTTYKVESTTSITNPTALQADQNITYFDGLGRPIQQVAHQQSGSGKDIVTPIEYDAFGRQEKEYLPYVPTAAASLNFKTTALTEVGTFYNVPKYENTSNPFSKKEFEASPLNRILKQAAPGEDWKLGNGHEIRLDYQTNTNADQVRRFGVSFISGNTENPYLEDNGIYDPSQLYKVITKDENWQASQTYPNDHTTEEFKDKEGRIVLKRTFNAEKWLDTYYVYDDYGNLTYVLPPKVFTYNSITQGYEKNYSFYADNESYNFNFFTNGINTYCDINVYIHSNTIQLDLYAYDFIPGSILKSGKIIDLDFTPTLPNMPLANIMMNDAQGNPVLAGTAYIQDGDLYFSSTGAMVYPNSAGYYVDYFSNELTPYQGNYTPPSLDRSSFSDLIYQYKYDGRNRLIEKKLPGKEWEEIVYNKLDLPILTRDSNLKGQNKWLFTKYDAFGRVAYTGVMNSNSSRADMQIAADAITAQYVTKSAISTTIAGTTIYYSNDTNVYPNSNILELHTINYFDNYSFDADGLTLPSSVLGIDIINYNNAANTQNLTKGLSTGTKVRILDPIAPYWITTITGYDAKGRAIYTAKTNNYLFTTDVLQSKLDFIGKIEKTFSTHTKKTAINGTVINTVTVEDIFTYDQAGRLLKQTQAVNGAATPEIIVANTYDELGQLISKKVGGKLAQGLQTVDYAYNIRGWLKSINNTNNLGTDLFGYGLYYNTVVVNSSLDTFNSIPLYNGNISSISWKTNNLNSNSKQYNYSYDALNRFKEGKYFENEIFNNQFGEYIHQYDRNGNILEMIRNMPVVSSTYQTPGTVMDNLKYSYDSGNKLMSVNDPYSPTQYIDQGFFDGNKLGNDYQYDANGNLLLDKNKGITDIVYNYLNLPTKVTLATGTIDYVYDATGVKQSKKVNPGVRTDYASGFQYEDNVLKFFPQPEGYVEYNSGNFNYIYQYKDHLGNVRLSYSDNNNDGVILGAATEIYKDDFESSSNWDSLNAQYGASVTAYDTSKKYSGNISAKIEKLTTGELYVHSNTWININNTETTDYIFSGWVYSNGPSADIFFFMKTNAETGYYTNFDYVRSNNINRWVYLEKKVSVPSNITSINLRIDNNGGGTVWFDDVSIKKVNPNNEIIEENNYYPFGMKHKDNNVVTSTNNPALKYKYQGQERQDELGLNWDSFKWRNYDYAIGRFMCIDPLAEQYAYNSPYAFQENKLGLGRELEGLELYSERSQDGKSITLTYTVNIVNNTNNATSAQVSQMVSERMCSTENSFSGQTKNGETVTAKVVYDPKATITWEYNDAITVENGQAGEPGGKGYTSANGNTQVNKTQVNVPNNVEFDKNGNSIISDKSNPTATKTGSHEDGHVGGLKHTGGDKPNLMNNKDNSTNITQEQRTEIIKKVEIEQPLKN
ncbi:DUF6443 domain-containing protein [Flavobacterium ajazii]|uniref:DUF6443 domain-containing protein n=1 Tax=Flavobacterium ajazii TaxID=2692318 RepID=UPI0013D7E676|nr:DUF6443 domain-containing protein [Flavobacterium ajazii]